MIAGHEFPTVVREVEGFYLSVAGMFEAWVAREREPPHPTLLPSRTARIRDALLYPNHLVAINSSPNICTRRPFHPKDNHRDRALLGRAVSWGAPSRLAHVQARTRSLGVMTVFCCRFYRQIRECSGSPTQEATLLARATFAWHSQSVASESCGCVGFLTAAATE